MREVCGGAASRIFISIGRKGHHGEHIQEENAHMRGTEKIRHRQDRHLDRLGWRPARSWRGHLYRLAGPVRYHTGGVRPATRQQAHELAQSLRSEFVISVTGKVELRPEGTANPEIATGEIDVAGAELMILNKAETPPFPIENDIESTKIFG